MSRTFKDTPNSKHNRPRRSRRRDVTIRVVRRTPPDVSKLSRALIALALAEAQQGRQDEPDAGPETETGWAAEPGADDQAPDRSPNA